MTLKPNRVISRLLPLRDSDVKNASRYRVKNIPGTGAILKPEDRAERQLSLMDD